MGEDRESFPRFYIFPWAVMEADHVEEFLPVFQDMGGDEAPLEPKESIAGMLKVLDDDSKSGIDATGSFFDWNGTPMGW